MRSRQRGTASTLRDRQWKICRSGFKEEIQEEIKEEIIRLNEESENMSALSAYKRQGLKKDETNGKNEKTSKRESDHMFQL